MNDESPSTALADLLAAGQRRRAGEWLVRHHASDVYAVCRAMSSDDSTAQDLVQDVFSRAFQALDGYRGDASPRTWLLTIARHRCIDHLRQRRRQPFGPDEAIEADLVQDDAVSAADLLARRDLLQSALAALTEGERALVVLRHGHGVGYDELADAFGLRPATVRMRVSRALLKMRDHARAEEVLSAPRGAAPPALPGILGRLSAPMAPPPASPTPSLLHHVAPTALVERLLAMAPG